METKKLFTVLFLLCSIFNYSLSQNAIYVYYEQPSSNVSVSMITLTHPENYTNFVVGTNTNSELFISKLDFSRPPEMENVRAFKLHPDGSNYGRVYIKGGFWDSDNNIVVYGYEDNDKKGLIAKIYMNEANYAESVMFRYSTKNNSIIRDGCATEFRQYPNQPIPLKTYDFISDMDSSILVIINKDNLASFNGKKFKRRYASINSVAWNDTDKVRILTGCIAEDSLVVGYINNNYGLNSGEFHIMSINQYFENPYLTGRSVLASHNYYNDGIIYIANDIRRQGSSADDLKDGILVTEMNYITGNINFNNAYLFSNPKSTVIDINHNFENLYVLATYNYGPLNTVRRTLTQINLLNPSNYVTKYLGYINLYGGDSELSIRQNHLNNISLNNFFTMYTSGSMPGYGAHLIETTDLSYDNCNPNINMYTYNNILTSEYSTTTIASLFSTYSLGFENPFTVTAYNTYDMIGSEQCSDYAKSETDNNSGYDKIINIIEEKKAIYGNNPLITNDKNITSTLNGDINIYDKNHFVCNNFTGICKYKVIDLSGRILHEGTTQNGEYNKVFINTSGAYIIQISDENQQVVSKKFIYTE